TASQPRAAATPGIRRVPSADARIVVAQDVGELYQFIKQEILSRAGFVVVSVLWVMVIINLLLSRWVARPVHLLSEAADRLGRGDYSGHVATSWGTDELNLLAASFEQARERLSLAEQSRRADLDRARRTQRALLPTLDEPIDGLKIAADYRPAEQVGGDLYDVMRMSDGGVMVMIGDPTGHGIPAALMMAVVKMDLWHLASPRVGAGSLSAMTCQLARDLSAICEATEFVTFLVVQLRPGGGPARYLNAGHVPGRLMRADGSAELLEPTGPLIGDIEHDGWAEREIMVRPGDRLVLVTDGLLDAENAAGELFGYDRLDALLAQTRPQPPAEVVRRVQEDLASWVTGGRASDDITVLVVDCTELDAKNG
ncbi:MAG: SpoIIE family protein phosphatase, partial [Phycisphaerae bacterium]|nr:SpoIIE family protein phosphatase [Phycisphaerae bacterium]